jgi:hypothetical protein
MTDKQRAAVDAMSKADAMQEVKNMLASGQG